MFERHRKESITPAVIVHDGSIREPSLIFFPRPHRHRLIPDGSLGPELVCATLNFDGGTGNPLSAALPDHVVLALSAIPTLGVTLDWLFNEAFSDACGRNAVMDRLFELLVIQLLRHFLSDHSMGAGMLAGLADLRLAKALNLMHAQPENLDGGRTGSGLRHVLSQFCGAFSGGGRADAG